MSVECYALVTFKGELTDFEKNYNDSMREQGLRRAMLVAATPIIKLCRIRLVQGKGRKGSVPKPRWEVVEELEEVIIDYGGPDTKEYIDDIITYEGVFFKEYGKDYPLLTKETSIADFDEAGEPMQCRTVAIQTIDNRTIQLRHIRSLFPECATMPFAIALDYVRDKL